MTYTEILYKASIENIDSDFKFKTSKLNEFRNMYETIIVDRKNCYYKLVYNPRL